jgi:hypothetical protein
LTAFFVWPGKSTLNGKRLEAYDLLIDANTGDVGCAGTIASRRARVGDAVGRYAGPDPRRLDQSPLARPDQIRRRRTTWCAA